MMEIEKRQEGSILVLGLVGDFDTTETEGFRAEIATSVDSGFFRVLLDLLKLEFVNSTALGCLLWAQKLLAQYGGGMAGARAGPVVAKTFRLLELDRRIPLFPGVEEAMAHLATLEPKAVRGGGEEVELLVEGAPAFGRHPRRGRIEEVREDGLSVSFENLSGLDLDAAFPTSAVVRVSFQLPLYHPTHVFEAKTRLDHREATGRETLLLGLSFTEIGEAEQAAVSQYVKDLRALRDG